MATADQILTLRDFMNDETVPYRYTDQVLGAYIDKYTYPECSAYYLYSKEMGKALMTASTNLKKSASGQESHEYVSIDEIKAYYQTMMDIYSQLCSALKGTSNPLMVKVKRLSVAGISSEEVEAYVYP